MLPIADAHAVSRAADAMRRGEVVAFPTDTVYGLGTALHSRAGIARIFALKGRAGDKALPVLIGDAGDLPRVVATVPDLAMRLIEHFWPGPLTLVLPRHPDVPDEVAPGRSSLGVRLPDYEPTLDLLRAVGGPVASSSANRSGAPPALRPQDVLSQFPTGLTAVLDGGPAPGGVASTVLDLTDPELPVVLREGAIARAALESVLHIAVR